MSSSTTASRMWCCSEWADRVWRRKCYGRSSERRQAGRSSTCSTRPIPRRSARSQRPLNIRCICWPASPAPRSNRTRLRLISVRRSSTQALLDGPVISSPSQTKGRSWRAAPDRNPFGKPSSTRPTSAAATRPCRTSVWCPPMGQDVAALIGIMMQTAQRTVSEAIRSSRRRGQSAVVTTAGAAARERRDKLTCSSSGLEPWSVG